MSHKILVGLGTAAGGVVAAGLISRSGLQGVPLRFSLVYAQVLLIVS